MNSRTVLGSANAPTMNFTTVSGSEVSHIWNFATVSDAVSAPELCESLRQLDDPAMSCATVSGSVTILPGILRESQALRRFCQQLHDRPSQALCAAFMKMAERLELCATA